MVGIATTFLHIGLKAVTAADTTEIFFFFPKSEDKVGSVRQQGAVGGREGKDMNEQIKGFVRLRMYKVV